MKILEEACARPNTTVAEVHWELLTTMRAADVQLVIQQALSGPEPRLTS